MAEKTVVENHQDEGYEVEDDLTDIDYTLNTPIYEKLNKYKHEFFSGYMSSGEDIEIYLTFNPKKYHSRAQQILEQICIATDQPKSKFSLKCDFDSEKSTDNQLLTNELIDEMESFDLELPYGSDHRDNSNIAQFYLYHPDKCNMKDHKSEIQKTYEILNALDYVKGYTVEEDKIGILLNVHPGHKPEEDQEHLDKIAQLTEQTKSKLYLLNNNENNGGATAPLSHLSNDYKTKLESIRKLDSVYGYDFFEETIGVYYDCDPIQDFYKINTCLLLMKKLTNEPASKFRIIHLKSDLK